MKIFKNIVELRSDLQAKQEIDRSMGFVPTMGTIHNGHLSLVARSLSENDLTVCSIFINPTQFNNQEDLIKYPVQTAKDIEQLTSLGCDILFIPPQKEIYTNESLISLDFGEIESILEGKFRPGHFAGVGLIVLKFFNIVQPDKAYFGQKDLQQLAIIRKLVKELNYPIEIVEVETQRDSLGLALSSRNNQLSLRERKIASHIYNSLNFLKTCILDDRSFADALTMTHEHLKKKMGLELEYLEIVDSRSMVKINSMEDAKQISVCIAAKVGGVRLIDNIYIKK